MTHQPSLFTVGSLAGPLICVSLYQPWASMIPLGLKRNETRSWGTPYRGRLGIHATKALPVWVREEFAGVPSLAELLDRQGIVLDHLPRGAIVATAELVGIIRLANPAAALAFRTTLPRDEALLGDYTPGRFVWRLDNVAPLAEPIPASGARGLWRWEGRGTESADR